MGLEYVTPSTQSESESAESLPYYSSNSSDWEFNVRWGLSSRISSPTWYQSVRCSKTKTLSHLILIHGLNNWIFNGRNISNNVSLLPRIKYPTPKLISISKSLSHTEKQDLKSLIWEYIDVFAWSNEDMLGLDPHLAMHRLNIKLDSEPVNQ